MALEPAQAAQPGAPPTSAAGNGIDTEALAVLQDIRFRYPGHHEDLLSDVHLVIRPGEVVMLAGPNGSGKSTLLGLLSGRLRPSRGQVRVLGADPAHASRTPELGLVTEPFHPEQSPLPVDFTGQQILRWLAILDGVSSAATTAILEELELDPRLLNARLARLSRGERQRLALAIVLLRRPRLILADEPLEGIDRTSRRLVGKTLHRYSRQAGHGVVWVSHHLGEDGPFADRLLEIQDGTIAHHSGRRFQVRVTGPDGSSQDHHLGSLDMLSGLAETALRASPTLRLEMTDLEPERKS